MVARSAAAHFVARRYSIKSRALFLFVSFAGDLDLIGDILFYLYIQNSSPQYGTVALTFCTLGGIVWLSIIVMGISIYGKVPLFLNGAVISWLLCLGIFLQDLPQVAITLAVEARRGAPKKFSGIATFNVMSTVYGILAKVAEVYENQDDPLVSADCTSSFSGHVGEVYSVATLPGGRAIATGSYDRTVKLWDVATGVCLRTLEGHTNMVRAVAAVSPSLVVSGSRDKTVRLWEVTTGKCAQVLVGHTHRVRAVAALSPSTVVSGASDRTIKIWDVETGACIKTLEGHGDSVNSVTFVLIHDAVTVVSASSDTTIKLWNSESGECVCTLEGHTDSVNCVAVVRGAGSIASASDDKTIKVWNTGSAECIRTLVGHTHWVYSVAVVSPDILVSGSRDKTVKLWDLTTGACVKTLKGHRSWVDAVAVVSPEVVASTSDDNTVKVWHLKLKRGFEMVPESTVHPL
jgi:WD40 repeat protein